MKRAVLIFAFVAAILLLHPERIFTLEKAFTVDVPQAAAADCDILAQTQLAPGLLASVSLDVGKEPLTYYEDRISGRKSFEDAKKEIALAVLNTDNCRIQVIKIIQNGASISNPAGWDIEPVTRFNGIQWNYWNTNYAITRPQHQVVIGNKYPDVTFTHVYKSVKNKKTGKWSKVEDLSKLSQTVEYRIYVPYSEPLHQQELIQAGSAFLHELVQQAMTDLAVRQVRSRALPTQRIAELSVFSSTSFERLPLMEQIDLSEFRINRQRATERTLVLLALNQNRAYQYTCSKAGACGMFQFTKETYNSMVKLYPSAGLIPDFIKGAQDPANSIKAAILLYDNNLRYLVGRYGKKILQDPRIDEFMAAYYNASPGKVNVAISPALKRPDTYEWITKLPSETRGYIQKFRYLDEIFATLANPS